MDPDGLADSGHARLLVVVGVTDQEIISETCGRTVLTCDVRG
jgi:hypothetical protein